MSICWYSGIFPGRLVWFRLWYSPERTAEKRKDLQFTAISDQLTRRLLDLKETWTTFHLKDRKYGNNLKNHALNHQVFPFYIPCILKTLASQIRKLERGFSNMEAFSGLFQSAVYKGLTLTLVLCTGTDFIVPSVCMANSFFFFMWVYLTAGTGLVLLLFFVLCFSCLCNITV